MTIPLEPLADALKTIEAMRALLKAEELELEAVRQHVEILQLQITMLIDALSAVRDEGNPDNN